MSNYHHVSDEFLREKDVGEFMELPLWVNSDLAESFMTFSIERALAAGLQFSSARGDDSRHL